MKSRFKIRQLVAVGIIAAIAFWIYTIFRGPSAEELLGVSLPPSAKVIDTADRAGMFGGDYFAIIEMTEDDFAGLIQRMGLLHRPNLLNYWSGALRAPKDVRFWNVSEINDENTFFGDKRHSTYLVARYERGKMYYKVHVY